MDNPEKNPPEQQEYVPRPVWQVWAARIALALMIGFVIYQLVTIAGAGL